MNELILGLLCIKNMTSYDIKKAIQNGMDLICSDSMGSIQVSIKKLVTKNYINFEEVVENGKRKKIYTITDEGRKYFDKWINSPFIGNQKRSPELKKIFFMAFSDKTHRKERVEDYINLIEVERDKLYSIKNMSVKIMESVDDTQREIGLFQMETIQYGLDLMEFEINWYQNFLKRI